MRRQRARGEAIERDAVSREQFLARAILAGGALTAGGLLVAGLPRLAASAASPAQDKKILNFALLLEYLQAAFYTEAERLGAIKGKLAQIPPQLGAVERAHVKAIKAALGRAAVKRAIVASTHFISAHPKKTSRKKPKYTG